MDLNFAKDSLLGLALALCTKEEGYPLETSTDDRCFFLLRDGRHFTITRFTDRGLGESYAKY